MIAQVSDLHEQTTHQTEGAILHGLNQLIQGQRRFADEFGLTLNRVFPQSFQFLQGKDSLIGIRQIINTDISLLINDLYHHQLALIHALDGIALSALKQCDKGSKREELLQDQNLRFKKIISPGFIKKYTRSRELTQR